MINNTTLSKLIIFYIFVNTWDKIKFMNLHNLAVLIYMQIIIYIIFNLSIKIKNERINNYYISLLNLYFCLISILLNLNLAYQIKKFIIWRR